MALTRITKGVIKPNENYDTHNINSTGIITAVSANFSGNVTIGGTLTYEDVTSVDVVGVMTATGADINGDLDVDGHTNLDNVSIAGVTTFASSIHIADSIIHQGDTDTKIEFLPNDIRTTVANKLRIHHASNGLNYFNGNNISQATSTHTKLAGSDYVHRFRDEEGDDTLVQFFNTNAKNSVFEWNAYGNTSAAGNLIFRDLNSGKTEYARFTGTGSFNIAKDLDVDGHTNLDNVSVAGVSTFTGAIDANGDLDVDGHTELDNANISGVVTFTSSPNAIQMNDSARVSFGTSLKTSISYNTSSSRTVIRNYNDTLEIGYRTTELHYINQARLTIGNGSNTFSADASTTFLGDNYHAGWYPSSNGGTFKINDNGRLAFGSNGDTNFFHNNSHFYLQNTTGNINVTGNVVLNDDLDVDGHTNLDNVSIAGVTTAGNLSGSNANFTGELTVAEMVGHTGDTHTKLSFPANDTIAFTTGGTERLRIGSNGYIGVGDFSSKSRTDPLNVDSGIGTCNIGGNYIHLSRYSGGGTNYITAPQNNANLHISADDYISIGVDHSSSIYSHNTEAIRIASNGNVGIGTNILDSSANLSITDTGSARIYLKSGNTSDTSIYFGRLNDSATAAIRYEHSTNAFDFYGYNNSKRMTILSGGNIGVGNANPTQARLVVENSSGNTIAAVKSGNAGAIALGGPSQPRILIEAGQSSSDLLIYTAQGSSWGTPTWQERLRIDSAGHVLPRVDVSYDLGANTSYRWRNIYGQTLSLTSYATVGSIVAADPGSSYYAYNNRIGNGLAVVGTTRLFGKIGIGQDTPSFTRSYGLDITNTDNTTGHGVLTDQRGRSDLVIRNKSGTLYSYSQLMFTNGNDGYNSATFLRHTKGGYLNNENYVGDLILMTRVAGNGSANPDFRERTIWPGGTTKARQVWWANGTGQEGNGTHNGWHHLSEQNPQGNNEYQYFTLDLGAASYSRAGLARYTILWNTGHASGTGHQTGEFRWFNHHGNTTCNLLEHIILRRGYNNGSYYGWNDAPLMKLHHSSNTGNDACIHFKCQGRRSSGYNMSLYVTVFLDLYAPKSSNGNVTPALRARGYSAPSDMSSSEYTNQGRNASYVSYQSSAPPLAQNP